MKKILINGVVVERELTEQEIAEQEKAEATPIEPTQEERIAALEEALTALLEGATE